MFQNFKGEIFGKLNLNFCGTSAGWIVPSEAITHPAK
jgi:hypothetical protein